MTAGRLVMIRSDDQMMRVIHVQSAFCGEVLKALSALVASWHQDLSGGVFHDRLDDSHHVTILQSHQRFRFPATKTILKLQILQFAVLFRNRICPQEMDAEEARSPSEGGL